MDAKKRQTLRELANGCGPGISPGEKEQFYHLLLSYAYVMACSTTDLGRTDKLRHSINTGVAAPIRQPVRRISPHRREEVCKLLTDMRERGVIEPSTSPWASPIVIIQKKDGSLGLLGFALIIESSMK